MAWLDSCRTQPHLKGEIRNLLEKTSIHLVRSAVTYICIWTPYEGKQSIGRPARRWKHEKRTRSVVEVRLPKVAVICLSSLASH